MLRINVNDTITVNDDLENIIEYVVEAVKSWHEGDKSEPFSVTVTNEQNKSPPPLEVYVHDVVKVKSVFGT